MASTWSYPHPGLAHGSPVSRDNGGLAQYSSTQVPASYPGSSLAATSLPASMHPVSSFSGTAYPYGPSRQSYPSSYGHSFSDDMFQGYSFNQSAQFQHPSHDSQLPSLDYVNPDLARQWTPVAPGARQSSQSFSIEQEGSTRYGPLAYSHSSIAVHPDASVPADRSGMFPRMSNLESHLPALNPRKSRALPAPASRRASISHSTNAMTGVTDPTAPLGMPQNLNYRSSIPWTTEGPAAENNEGSSSSTSSTMSGRDLVASNFSPSPQVAPKSAHFDPQPISSGSSGRASYYTPLTMTTLPPNMDTEALSKFSKGHKMGYHTAGTGHYGYSLGSDARNDTSPMIPEGTLVSGQHYTSLGQSNPLHAYEERALSEEKSSPVPHRTSTPGTSTRRAH
ncbi:MAG: hypothetical protein Q9191_002798 [Dirinaria sp. TL-2023a]